MEGIVKNHHLQRVVIPLTPTASEGLLLANWLADSVDVLMAAKPENSSPGWQLEIAEKLSTANNKFSSCDVQVLQFAYMLACVVGDVAGVIIIITTTAAAISRYLLREGIS